MRYRIAAAVVLLASAISWPLAACAHEDDRVYAVGLLQFDADGGHHLLKFIKVHLYVETPDGKKSSELAKLDKSGVFWFSGIPRGSRVAILKFAYYGVELKTRREIVVAPSDSPFIRLPWHRYRIHTDKQGGGYDFSVIKDTVTHRYKKAPGGEFEEDVSFKRSLAEDLMAARKLKELHSIHSALDEAIARSRWKLSEAKLHDLWRMEKYEESISQAESLVSLYPAEAELFSFIGATYFYKLERFDKAREWYLRGFDRSSNKAFAAYRAAVFFKSEKVKDLALAEKFAKLSLQHSKAKDRKRRREFLVDFYVQSRQYSKALTILDSIADSDDEVLRQRIECRLKLSPPSIPLTEELRKALLSACMTHPRLYSYSGDEWGNFLRARRMNDLALQLAKKNYEAYEDKSSSWAYKPLITHYEHTKNHTAIQELGRALLGKYPKDYLLCRAFARSYAKRRNFRKAKKILEGYVERNPRIKASAVIHEELAELALMENLLAVAERHFLKALEIHDSRDGRKRLASFYLESANEPRKSIRLWEGLLRRRDGSGYWGIAEAHTALGTPEKAVPLLRAFVRSDPNFRKKAVGAYLLLSLALERKGKLQEAKEIVDEVASLYPECSVLSFRLARMKARLGDKEGAFAALRDGISFRSAIIAHADTAFSGLWADKRFAETFDLQGILNKELASTEKTIQQRADLVQPLLRQMQALRRLGRNKNAIALGRKILDSIQQYRDKEEYAVWIYDEVARNHIVLDEADLALKTYRNGIEAVGRANPGVVNIMINCGQLLASLGRFREAIELADDAIRVGVSPYGNLQCLAVYLMGYKGLKEEEGLRWASAALESYRYKHPVGVSELLYRVGKRKEASMLLSFALRDARYGFKPILALQKYRQVNQRRSSVSAQEIFGQLAADPDVRKNLEAIGRVADVDCFGQY